jgi:hypothetical protein
VCFSMTPGHAKLSLDAGKGGWRVAMAEEGWYGKLLPTWWCGMAFTVWAVGPFEVVSSATRVALTDVHRGSV